MSFEHVFPDLTAPVLIGAFAGWNDAARAASGAIEHLELNWDARPLAAIDPEDYYDFQVNRPTVSLVDGVSRRLEWPTTHFSVCRPPRANHDVVFMRGLEPNYRWATFCDEILDIVRDLGVEQIILLGSLQMQTHYARGVPMSGSAYDGPSASRFGLDQTRYEGPTGITGVLHDMAVRIGIPAFSFWAGVPYYLPWESWPPATLALLHRVEEVLDIPVPVGTLPEQGDDIVARAAEVIESDSDLRALLQDLDDDENVPDLQATSGDALAQEFERYLKRRADDDPSAEA